MNLMNANGGDREVWEILVQWLFQAHFEVII